MNFMGMQGDSPDGNDLFHQVVALTGVPMESMAKELCRLLELIGTSPEAMTEEDLRMVALLYLGEVTGSESTH